MNPETLYVGLVSYVVFLLSTTCHEASHALAAKVGGDMTAFEGGQVTLNPVPHVKREPIGMVLVPLLGIVLGGMVIGWASAPYDPEWARKHPIRAAWMSLAGPAANFTLALLAALCIHLGIWAGVMQAPDLIDSSTLVQAVHAGAWVPVSKVLSIVLSMNLLLGAFNLLPLPPLDGFGALPLLMTQGGAERMADLRDTIRGVGFLGLLLAWKLFDILYDPLFDLAIRVLYPHLRYG